MISKDLFAAGAPPGPVGAVRSLPRSLAKAAHLAVALTGVVVILSGAREMFTTEGATTLRGWIHGFGPWAGVVFLAIVTAGVGLGAPRLFFACVGGAAFGAVQGVVLAQIGTVLGCLLVFLYGRALGRGPVDRILGERAPGIQGVLDRIGENGIAANVCIRFLPVGNCHVTNLLMSVSPISLRQFLVGTFLGTLPQTFICALIGSGVSLRSANLWMTGVVSLVVLTFVSYLVVCRSRFGRVITSALLHGKEGRE